MESQNDWEEASVSGRSSKPIKTNKNQFRHHEEKETHPQYHFTTHIML